MAITIISLISLMAPLKIKKSLKIREVIITYQNFSDVKEDIGPTT